MNFRWIQKDSGFLSACQKIAKEKNTSIRQYCRIRQLALPENQFPFDAKVAPAGMLVVQEEFQIKTILQKRPTSTRLASEAGGGNKIVKV